MWDGTSWRMVPIPGAYTLMSVSCLSERFCLAVGGMAEVDQWNGHTWSPRPSVPNFVLSSLSCVSTHFCDAIGSDASGNDAETWNGTTWRPQPSPPPPHGDTAIIVNAVSCATQNYCVVVGGTPTDLATGVAAAVIDVWNGHAWAARTAPANPKATGSYLNAVSCTSTTSCTAVGDYTFGTPPIPGAPLPFRTLAETWNGTAWKLRVTPNPNPTANALSDVSCRPGHSCTAVGSASDLGGIQATLIETGS